MCKGHETGGMSDRRIETASGRRWRGLFPAFAVRDQGRRGGNRRRTGVLRPCAGAGVVHYHRQPGDRAAQPADRRAPTPELSAATPVRALRQLKLIRLAWRIRRTNPLLVRGSRLSGKAIEQREEFKLGGRFRFVIRIWPPVATCNPEQRLAAHQAGRSPASARTPRAVRVAMMSERLAKQPTHSAFPQRTRVGTPARNGTVTVATIN